MRNSRGFTLIELLVVISVISIILGIAIPRFKGMQVEANRAKAKAELKTLQTAVESYYINHNPQIYPDTTDDICQDSLVNADPRIVATVLYDPFASSGTEYKYKLSTNGLYYVIYSVGQNSIEEITGIGDDGAIEGDWNEDEIFVTNGTAN